MQYKFAFIVQVNVNEITCLTVNELLKLYYKSVQGMRASWLITSTLFAFWWRIWIVRNKKCA
ncbi:hypothetical protein BCU12_01865 [Vibrio sp. 10N.261.55.A7]|nr:hypothetical protein BCU12_01865 [Vibrio sp. 10N.261.55.A7]